MLRSFKGGNDVNRTYLNSIEKENMPRINAQSFKTRQNVTVVPLNFDEPAPLPVSPRNHSKTKLKLVSPSMRNSSILKENNPPKSPPHEERFKQRSTVQIELGGKLAPTLDHQRNRQSGEFSHFSSQNNTVFAHSRSNSREILIQSSFSGVGKEGSSVFTSMRPTSPARISIHYQPSQGHPIQKGQVNPQILQHQKIENDIKNKANPSLTSPLAESISNQKSSKKTIPMNLHNFSSDFEIKEENTIDNLKESYESEMDEIKRLQEEIASNNQQIKQLLKSSKASLKRSQPNSKKFLVQREEEKVENLAKSREPSIWSPDESRDIQEDPAIFSKKTLINDLKIQTQNRIEKVKRQSRDLSGKIRRSNGDVSVQADNQLPVESNGSQNSHPSETKVRRLSMVKNQECQVQVVSTSQKKIQSVYNDKRSEKSEKSSMKGSIIHEANTSQHEEGKEGKNNQGGESIELIKSRKTPGRISQQKIEMLEQKQVKIIESIGQYSTKKDETKEIYEQKQCSPIPVSQKLLPQPSIPTLPPNPQQKFKTVSVPSIPHPTSPNTHFVPSPPRKQPNNLLDLQKGRKISNRIYL